MKLLVQPDHGLAPLVAALKGARKTIEIVIFRFDRREIEAALKAAVERRVIVRALIAHTNRDGEKSLRKLEARFLEGGVIVARTADDLARYHGKMMIIDGRVLYVLSFNLVHVDIDESRCFGIVTRNAKLVQEARKLFEADAARQLYMPGLNTFLVSPLNARKELAAFLRKARKQLLIYDPQIADPQMIHLLQERLKAGVEVRIIGHVAKRSGSLRAATLPTIRLHTRTIIRDRHQAFVGSQGLRTPELSSRREIGVIVRDPKVVNSLLAVFERDWASTALAKEQNAAPALDAGALAKELQPLAHTVRQAVKKAVANADGEALADGEVKATVKKAVKKAVKEAMKEAVQEKQESN
ncbi:MAG: phospholipase D-like domain-containing protein [Terriglobales bacterium]